MKCEVCGKEFVLDKSLHAHIKAHQLSVAEYYIKHFPRKDLHTGGQIEFKNKKQYFQSYFNSVSNMKKWLTKKASTEEGIELLRDVLLTKLHETESFFFPSDLYLRLAKLPDKDFFNLFFGNIFTACEELNLENIHSQELPEDFWRKAPNDVEILIDTREQKPIGFNNSEWQKLDFGDYTSRNYYSKTFIERKGPSDFVSTLTQGYDRICREITRCDEFNSYLFMLVETTPEKLYPSLVHKPKNMEYVWHQAKQLMLEFPNNFQICFSGNRKGSQYLIPRILYHGQKLWRVDLDYYLRRKIKQDVVD